MWLESNCSQSGGTAGAQKTCCGIFSSDRSVVKDLIPFPVVCDGWKTYNPHEEHATQECSELINPDLFPAVVLLLPHALKGVLVAFEHYVLQQGSCEEEESTNGRTWHDNLRADMLLEGLDLNCLGCQVKYV